MSRRRLSWLVAAAALFALAALLMSRGDPDEPAPVEPRVRMPRSPNTEEWQRMRARKVLPAAPAPVDPATPARPRDPLLAALPREPGRTAVVIEANALTNSPVGDLLLACARHDSGEDPIQAAKSRTGIDLLKDVDRVAVSERLAMLSGQFGDADWQKLTEGTQPTSWGEKGTLFTPGEAGAGPSFARWGDQMVLFGPDAQELKDAIDRLEGRASEGAAPVGEEDSYGEVYGVLGPDLLDRMLGPAQPELARRLQEVASRISLHVSAMGDVGIVADVDGSDREKADDLARSLGAALSLGRLKAQAEGDQGLAELLDLAKVSPQGARFSVELALPMAFLEKHLAFCREGARRDDAGTSP